MWHDRIYVFIILSLALKNDSNGLSILELMYQVDFWVVMVLAAACTASIEKLRK